LSLTGSCHQFCGFSSNLIAKIKFRKIVNCEMLEIIKEKLTEIERQHHVRILYACESGSRAWGFPSPDSDFDVRFIYAGQQEDYLSIIEKKDVIDLPVNEVLDIGGWDIRKALKLFLKSNSPLYEWLQSPIVYDESSGFANELRRLMGEYFSLRAGGHHYLSMTLNTINNDLQAEKAKIKRYCYALRSALACKWIVERQTVPPMEFGKLLVQVNDQSFQSAIDDLLKVKAISDEKTLIDRIDILDNWLSDTVSACISSISQLPAIHHKPEALNVIFRKYISR
jgi:predicted nucleotidyltransferase